MSTRARLGIYLMIVGFAFWFAATIQGDNQVPCYVLFLAGATLATHNDPPKEKQ